MEVNGEVKVYVDFAADVGGDVEVIQGHNFVDTLGWIRDRKDKDKLAEVGQFWGSLKA